LAAEGQRSAEELLRRRGLRVTAQRRHLLQLLIREEGRHWTADELLMALRTDLPEMARGTAYHVLEELVAAGVAEELATEQGARLYGLRLTEHHHFVCDACHRWFDVAPSGVDRERLPDGALRGAAVRRVDVILRGTCPECGQGNA
jgi:Fe2+ or Zn2+ uptake regulation protein